MTQGQILFLAYVIGNTFAGYTFCQLLYLQFRQYRLGTPVWGGWTWRALTFAFALSYLRQLADSLWLISSGGSASDPLVPHLANVVTRPFIGPLLAQLFYATERSRLPGAWLWRAMYAVAVPVALVWALCVLGVVAPGSANLLHVLRVTSDVMLAIGTVMAGIAIWSSRRLDDSAFRRRQRRWYLGVICLTVAGLLAAIKWWTPWLDALMKYVPSMLFVLVTVYYGERLTFFDVFVKRGVLFFLALVIVTCHFALASPSLAWIAVLTLMPLVLMTPWTYARLNAWIDRAWLRRRFSVADAVSHFSDSLQGATSEHELLECAESSLSCIFQSKACIDRASPHAEAGELRASIPIDGVAWGVVRLLPRQDEVPFFSEDAVLLRMLAHALGSSLDGQRLRDQGVAREQREQELMLSAARSELKALRAQINPHFLFNALNTIAALIPAKPDQAEQTVEQLAEVFRYAVRRSDREWVRLAEEIDFVRSYLDIERARFGDRLRVEIDIDRAIENVGIPALVIQTLAENAVKHGIATVRAPGIITISARSIGDRVVVSVRDNGPGFVTAFRFDAPPESSSVGYGLRNVQERLFAYYGAGAQLRFSRDADGAATVVSFEIPAVGPAGGAA